MPSQATHVVSPYLQAMPEDLVSRCVAMAPDSLRQEMERRLAINDLVLIFDSLHSCMVAASRSDLQCLQELRSRQRSTAALQSAEPAAFQRFIQNRLLLPETEAFRLHAYKSIEIEINRHCNYRCKFCPVEASPKPKGVMPLPLFELVLRRGKEYGANVLSLNHYSEPTLDPNLVVRLRMARSEGFTIRLHTNASLLTADKIQAMAELGGINLVINLPTVDRAEYERVTGAKLFDRVMDNLRLLHEHRLPVYLSINSPLESADGEVRKINERFASMFGSSVSWPTDSRSGRLDRPEYASSVHHAGLLNGCILAINQINVSYEGKAFLCCQDFDQQYILGDLREQNLREIAESARAVELRKWIFGYEESPENFLCRKCEWSCSSKGQPEPISVGSQFKLDLNMAVMLSSLRVSALGFADASA